MIAEATKKVVERQNLTAAEAEQVMDEIMSDEAEAVNMAAFLTALRMKGETVEEITAFAKGMRKHGIKVPVQGDVLEMKPIPLISAQQPASLLQQQAIR